MAKNPSFDWLNPFTEQLNFYSIEGQFNVIATRLTFEIGAVPNNVNLLFRISAFSLKVRQLVCNFNKTELNNLTNNCMN